MPDVFTKRKRSEVMSRIRGRGNKDTELALAKIFRAQRITGWRRHVEVRGRDAALRRPRPYRGRKISAALPPGTSQRDVPTFRVRPDFVFIKLKLAIFVDGCFWHGCPKHCNPRKWLKKSSMRANNPPSPKSRRWRTGRAFWRRKLSANKSLVTRTLRHAGWRVLRVWEHELTKKNSARLARRLSAAVSG